MKKNNVSRRSRPRQHVRKMRSGKRVLVNKGVKRSFKFRNQQRARYRPMTTSPVVNTFRSGEITAEQYRENLSYQAGVIAELRALELEAKAKGLMDVADEHRRAREKEESKLNKEEKSILEGRKIQKEVLAEGKAGAKAKDRSIKKYGSRRVTLEELYAQMRTLPPDQALKFYSQNNIDDKLKGFKKNASDVNSSDATLTANTLANMFYNEQQKARVATGDLTSDEKNLIKVGERYKNMPAVSGEPVVRVKNPFGRGYIEGRQADVDRALKTKQFEFDVLAAKGKKDPVWSPDQIARFAALSELRREENVREQRILSGAAKEGAKSYDESLNERGITSERRKLLSQAERYNAAGDFDKVEEIMNEYQGITTPGSVRSQKLFLQNQMSAAKAVGDERAYNSLKSSFDSLPKVSGNQYRTPSGRVPRQVNSEMNLSNSLKKVTDVVPQTVNLNDVPKGMEKYFSKNKRRGRR